MLLWRFSELIRFTCSRYRCLLRCCLYASLSLFAVEARSETVLRGDVHRDGRVNVADATKVLRFAANLESPSATDLLAGDVDPAPGVSGRAYGDGDLTVGDAVRILRFSVGLIDSAGFYAGEAPAIDLTQVTLQVNTSAIDALYETSGAEAPVSVSFISSEPIRLGGFTFELAPQADAPPLTLVRVERGVMLPEGVDLVTTPSDLSSGVTTARVAFSAAHLAPVSGSGELFRLIVRASEPLPLTAAYRLTLSQTDFTGESADQIPAPTVVKEINYEN